VADVFGMGFGELVVLVIVAIVVIGPKDLPKVLRKLGQWSGKIRRMAGDLRAQSGIDDVLRAEGLGQDIAEIRKLARGELDAVSRDMRFDEAGAGAGGRGKNGGATDASGYPDPTLDDRYIAEEREHPQVGPDGFDAMPDTSFVYGASFPKSKYDRDPLYRTGSPEGEIPEDPPDHIAPPDADESAQVEAEGAPADATGAADGARANGGAVEPDAEASEVSEKTPEKTSEALP
jgi:sec-independent protein translocase protein TatB